MKMAVVIPMDKLLKGIDALERTGPIYVRLRDTSTSFRDKATGWTLKGDEIKELPSVSPSRYSQTLMAAIRTGRFVRVLYAGKTTKSKKRYEELVESIVKEYESVLTMPEITVEEGD